MSDRLQELRRQRTLVAEHLAWLDRQIAAAAGNAASPAPPAPAPLPACTPPAASALKPAVEASPRGDPEVAAEADAILAEYRVEPGSMKSDLKKGCFLYFFGALAFVALAIAVLYFSFQRK